MRRTSPCSPADTLKPSLDGFQGSAIGATSPADDVITLTRGDDETPQPDAAAGPDSRYGSQFDPADRAALADPGAHIKISATPQAYLHQREAKRNAMARQNLILVPGLICDDEVWAHARAHLAEIADCIVVGADSEIGRAHV